MDTRYPSGGTVFDYAVDPRTRAWVAWESRLPQGFKPPPDVPAYK
jgi:dynein heavy chain